MAENDKTDGTKDKGDAKGRDPGEEPTANTRPDQRGKLIGLGVAVAVLAVIVIAVLIGQGGGDGGDGGSVSTNLDEKPTISGRDGEPPTELETNDIVVGDGPEATPGSTVTVQYVGGLFETGEEFDASWDRGEPFEFELGSGSVIPGWDEGVPGMKVGGRRELVIPSDLAYGEQGSPPSIGPDQALVFVVDLVDVKPPEGAGKNGGKQNGGN